MDGMLHSAFKLLFTIEQATITSTRKGDGEEKQKKNETFKTVYDQKDV
jgi:hypothetical protein